jgi:alpha-D-xyloside xylohydrolase
MKTFCFWKRLLCCLLAVATCAAIGGCGPQTPSDDPAEPDDNPPTGDDVPPEEKPPLYTTPISEVIITSGGNRLAVNFCRDDVVHFRYIPDGEDFVPEDAVPESIAKYDGKYDAVCGEIEQGDTATVIRTEGVTVAIDHTTLAITITDLEGKEIFKSAAEAFSSNGQGKKASFVRDVAAEEHFFGLGNARGNDFTTLDHRNSIYDLWMHDDNVHAIIPLWYSTAGYGVYLNNSNRGSVSFKQDYSLSVEGGEMNFYFFYGPSFKTILTNWSELAGRMAMPPLYALGLTYRGFGQWNEDQLYEAIVSQLNAGISIDVAGVEPGWQTTTYPCSYAWSTNFTDDAAAFVESMHDLGLHVNLWEHPYVSPQASIYNAIKEYSLSSEQIGTREWEGNGGKYAFGGIVPDFTLEEARELYWQIHNDNLVSIGIDGYKIDETDSWGASNSLDVTFPGGLSNNAYHNILGTLTVNLMHEKYRDEYDLRTFIFSRGNYAGMQRFATTAYTDYYGFDQFVMSVIAQSYSGTYYTPEIRDTSTKNDVSYMRRAQLMFLTPFAMSNEWATQATVLGRSDAVIDCYTKYNQLHYSLIPYMYSLFWEQHNTGVGVTRSLIMEFQNDPKVYGIKNQFMLGDALMVCPVSGNARIATVDIYLPAGEKWMDFNSGYVYEGGKTIQYVCSAATLPLFVRMGSIIPNGHYGDNTADVVDTTLTLDIYPNADQSNFLLYEDDGSSYGYMRGEYATTELSAQLTNGQITCTLGARSGKYAVAARDCVMQIHYRALPTSVQLDGKDIAAAASLEAFNKATGPCYYYDANAKNDIDKIIYVRLTDDGKAHEVKLSVGAESSQVKPEIMIEGSLYECESADNEIVGAGPSNKTGASGNAIVGSLGNDGKNSLTMKNITVDQAGIYEVELMFYNGGADARMLNVSINGADAIPIRCYSNGDWNTPMSLIVPMNFKAGSNTITFGTNPGEGWAPDMDCIIVYDDEPIKVGMSGTVFYPADGEMKGALQLESIESAVGGVAISGFGVSANDTMTYTVTVAETGPYQLNINYSSPSLVPQSLDLVINGQASKLELSCTNSTHLFETLNQTVYLQAGKNTITLSCAGGPVVYECEAGSNHTNCTKQLAPRDNYPQSGGFAVGSLRSENSSFTISDLYVPEDGTYRVLIYAASGDRRTFRLSVNGEEMSKLYAAQTGHFHNFKPVEVELKLKKGNNTLKVFGYAHTAGKGDTEWMPNFDYITIPSVTQNIEIRVGAISVE